MHLPANVVVGFLSGSRRANDVGDERVTETCEAKVIDGDRETCPNVHCHDHARDPPARICLARGAVVGSPFDPCVCQHSIACACRS